MISQISVLCFWAFFLLLTASIWSWSLDQPLPWSILYFLLTHHLQNKIKQNCYFHQIEHYLMLRLPSIAAPGIIMCGKARGSEGGRRRREKKKEKHVLSIPSKRVHTNSNISKMDIKGEQYCKTIFKGVKRWQKVRHPILNIILFFIQKFLHPLEYRFPVLFPFNIFPHI